MTSFFRRLRKKAVGDGRLLRQLLTVLSGTTMAQLITIVGMIPLARLYSPTDFGFFAIAQSIVLAGSMVAALRYDIAIVLPESQSAARSVHRLASRIIMVASTVLAVVLLLAHRRVSEHYENPSFGIWLTVTALIVYAMAQILNTQNWLIRMKQFGLIAQNRMLAALLMLTAQLVCAPLVGGFEGLLIGMLVGQVVTLLVLNRRVPELHTSLPEDAPAIREMAVRYKKMPLLNAPNVLVDAVRDAGINILIGNIALGGLGQYSLANKATNAPVYLIRGAIAQVFLPLMARARPGELAPLVKRLLIRLGFVAAPVFLVFYWLAPWLFPLFLGDQWGQAGLIAQALMPWLFMNTFTSPLANVYVTTERQGWLLGFAVVYAAAPLIFLSTSTLPLLPRVQVMAWIMAAALMCMLAMTLIITRQFDRRGQAAEVASDVARPTKEQS